MSDDDELRRLRARVAVLEAGQRGDDLLTALLQAIPDFVYFKDRDRRFVRASGAFAEMFDRPTSEVVGSRDEDLFPPEVAVETVADDERVIAGEPIVDRIEGGVVAPGVERWVSTTKIPWRDAEGRLRGLLGISRDITRSKKRFDELQEEVMRAKRLEFLGRLTGGIAHDFNNLLMVILVSAQELCDRLQDDPDYLEDAKAIADSAANAQSLIQQLLSFSRPKTLSQQPVDINVALEELRGPIERLLPREVALHMDLTDVDVPIWIDPGQLAQVVLNLAVNARDAMPEGGTLSVRTETLEPPEPGAQPRVVLVVEDTGIGMSDETIAKIYEPLFTTKREGRGMGLGLATVQSILGAGERRADIEVDSAIGEGTRFRVIFEGVNAPLPRPAAEQRGPSSLAGTVLLLDDHQGVRATVRKMLRRCGLQVIEAASGRQAASLAGQHRGEIDLLLSDVILRDETGPEAAQLIKTERPDLPVIYMSGFSDHVFTQRGIELPSELLVKPFTEASLRSRVAQALRSA